MSSEAGHALLAIVCAVSLPVALGAFQRATWMRLRMRWAMVAAGAPASLVEPERNPRYDGTYLERFTLAAASVQIRDDGQSALSLYFDEILLRWDIFFAVSLAIFACSGDLPAAVLLSAHPFAVRGAAGPDRRSYRHTWRHW